MHNPWGIVACQQQSVLSASLCPAAPPPKGQPAAPLSLVDGQFVAGGQQINIHGVNW